MAGIGASAGGLAALGVRSHSGGEFIPRFFRGMRGGVGVCGARRMVPSLRVSIALRWGGATQGLG